MFLNAKPLTMSSCVIRRVGCEEISADICDLQALGELCSKHGCDSLTETIAQVTVCGHSHRAFSYF